MMKIVFVSFLISALFLTSCGAFNRSIAYFDSYSRVCIDGVSYLQFPSGATVEYDKTGKIKLCK